MNIASGAAPPIPVKATAREWIGLGILALPCLIYAMDLTVLNLAAPSLSADLRPSAAQLLWIIDIYGFVAAGALTLMGPLGDRIGRRKLLLIGSAAFAVLSLLAAFSRSAPMLILARALLGLAGATLAPSTLSLISAMFRDDRQKTFAISVWVASFSLGGALGPIIGGAVISRFWWGAVFLIPIPIMVMLLATGPRLLPEYANPDAGRLDLLSAALTLAGVLPIIYGIKRAAEGAGDGLAAAAAAIGVICLAIFVRRQTVLKEPFLDLRLFTRPAVAAALMINVLDFFVGFGILLLVAQFLQLVLGLSPMGAGLWGLPVGFGFVFGSLGTSAWLKLMRPAYVLGCGLGLGGLGLALMAYALDARSLILVTVGNTMFALGSAPGIAIVADLVVSAAPEGQSGAASAVSETATEFGGALGIALLGSLSTYLFRTKLSAMLPRDVTGSLKNQVLSGLGAAGRATDHLAGGAQVLASARAAYVAGASVALEVSACVSLAAAVLAITMFRAVPGNR